MKQIIKFKTSHESGKKYERSLEVFDNIMLPDYHEQVLFPNEPENGKVLIFLVGRKYFSFNKENDIFVLEIVINGAFVVADLIDVMENK